MVCLKRGPKLGKQSNYFTRTGPTIPQKRWWSLSVPAIPHLQRWCPVYIAPPIYHAVNSRKRFKLLWIVSPAMQASIHVHNENINESFQILRAINFVHVVHQLGGVLYNPPTTKHGGSSSSTLVMTTSLSISFTG